jgi:2'-5' RNA ligase
MRMFVAVVPPPAVSEHLAEFLAPRQQAGPELRWTVPEQWHLTLAFMADVAERHLEDLAERLSRAAARRTPFEVALAGGGAFPDAGRARVVYVGVDTSSGSATGPGTGGVELGRLATGARAAAGRAGAAPDGGRFRPHVTLARSRRPVEATRWLRVLDAYRGPTWRVGEVALVVSHLGEGPRRRPRHEVLDTFEVGGSAGRPAPEKGNGPETRP